MLKPLKIKCVMKLYLLVQMSVLKKELNKLGLHPNIALVLKNA
jgi:hypothetical protein